MGTKCLHASFLRALTGAGIANSAPATLAAEIFAAWQGADYIRTHDVAAARDALTVLGAVTRQAGTVTSRGRDPSYQRLVRRKQEW